MIVLGLAVMAGACALSESGLLVDAGGIGDVNVPEACSTLDAACLGALSSAWTPVALGDGGCGADWTPVHLRANAHDVAGSCVCGECNVVGAYVCDAGVPISGGDNNCGDSPFATATPGQCTNVNPTQHLKAHQIAASGTVGCFAANDAGTGAASDDFVVCIPGCSADFCGGPQECVMAEGAVGCPSGYNLAARPGTGVDPGCGPCPCEAGPPGDCAGTVTAFFQDNCQAADDAGTYVVDSCTVITAQYKSVDVELTAADASCAVTAAPTADASLTGVKTLCCR